MFLPLIQNRRSIRKYQEKAVEETTIDLLVEALLRAPTSMGNNSWEFVVVTDTELLGQLSRAKPHGATFFKNRTIGNRCLRRSADKRHMDRKLIDRINLYPPGGRIS